MLHLFSFEGTNANQKLVQLIKRVLWMFKHVNGGLHEFMLEMSCFMMLFDQLEWLRLMAIKT